MRQQVQRLVVYAIFACGIGLGFAEPSTTSEQIAAVTGKIHFVMVSDSSLHALPPEFSSWIMKPEAGVKVWEPPAGQWMPNGVRAGRDTQVQARLNAALDSIRASHPTMQYGQLYGWGKAVRGDSPSWPQIPVSVDVAGTYYDPANNQFQTIKPPMVVYTICDHKQAPLVGGTDLKAEAFDAFARQHGLPTLEAIIDGQLAAQAAFRDTANQMLGRTR